jgi:acetyl esterase/lipase
VRANSRKYAIDPGKISVVGGSAGGHLAAMVALTVDSGLFEGQGGNPGISSTVQAFVIMGAGVDQEDQTKTAAKPIQNQLTFFGGPYEANKELYRQGSPISHISKCDPPLLIIEGESDMAGQRYPAFRKNWTMPASPTTS